MSVQLARRIVACLLIDAADQSIFAAVAPDTVKAAMYRASTSLAAMLLS